MKKSTDIRTLKKLEKPTRYTIPDTRGLHLWIRSIDSKYWIFRYTFDGVRFDMSLGRFPLVTLPPHQLLLDDEPEMSLEGTSWGQKDKTTKPT